MSDEELLNAVAEFVSRWDHGATIEEVAPALTCGEVQSLAGVFSAMGRQGDADRWINGHKATESECYCDEAYEGHEVPK